MLSAAKSIGKLPLVVGVLLIGTLISTTVFGSAASLFITPLAAQAGVYTDLACDTNGVSIDFEIFGGDASTVAVVNVRNIDVPACAGKTLSLGSNLFVTQSTAVPPEGAPGDIDGDGTESGVKFNVPAFAVADLETISLSILN